MQYIKGLDAYREPGRTAVTFGKFDGLHRGHFKLVDQVKEYGRDDDVKSVVCAFDMSSAGKGTESPDILMTKDERAEHLKDHVDYLVECPFTMEFSQMEAEDFIRRVVNGVFHAAYVVIGTDFRFGRAKRGDIYMLEAYASEYGYELTVIEKERYADRVISSTYVKELIQKGRVDTAAILLGYHYQIQGTVEHGRKLGRTLGFPTVNVTPPAGKLMPPRGVYVTRVKMDGRWYGAVSNIGVKPTVSEENRVQIESHLFDYQGDAYKKAVSIELLQYLRAERKFAAVGELKEYVDRDILNARRYFDNNRIAPGERGSIF